MSAPQGGVGPHPAGAGLTVVDETGSTNDDARSLAVAGAAAGTVRTTGTNPVRLRAAG